MVYWIISSVGEDAVHCRPDIGAQRRIQGAQDGSRVFPDGLPLRIEKVAALVGQTGAASSRRAARGNVQRTEADMSGSVSYVSYFFRL